MNRAAPMRSFAGRFAVGAALGLWRSLQILFSKSTMLLPVSDTVLHEGFRVWSVKQCCRNFLADAHCFKRHLNAFLAPRKTVISKDFLANAVTSESLKIPLGLKTDRVGIDWNVEMLNNLKVRLMSFFCGFVCSFLNFHPDDMVTFAFDRVRIKHRFRAIVYSHN